jgi:hypothetical protein
MISRIETDGISLWWMSHRHKTGLTRDLTGNRSPYRTVSHGWAFRPTVAKQSTVYAVSGTAEAHGVNGTRAARVASASINEYERLSAKGAPHELAKAGAVRAMAERYDQHAQDRQRQQGRDRGGMER